MEILYRPPDFRGAWHYQDASTDLIRRAIDIFDWDSAFVRTNVNEKVFILNKTILNIISNFIPDEALSVDDKDPPWFPKKKKTSSKRITMFIAIEIVKATITCNT